MKKPRNACLAAAEQLTRDNRERATLVVQIHRDPHPSRGFHYAWDNLPKCYRRKMRLGLLHVLKALEALDAG
jgi:hypothetical protein